jgi:hypothetical protein
MAAYRFVELALQLQEFCEVTERVNNVYVGISEQRRDIEDSLQQKGFVGSLVWGAQIDDTGGRQLDVLVMQKVVVMTRGR